MSINRTDKRNYGQHNHVIAAFVVMCVLLMVVESPSGGDAFFGSDLFDFHPFGHRGHRHPRHRYHNHHQPRYYNNHYDRPWHQATQYQQQQRRPAVPQRQQVPRQQHRPTLEQYCQQKLPVALARSAEFQVEEHNNGYVIHATLPDVNRNNVRVNPILRARQLEITAGRSVEPRDCRVYRRADSMQKKFSIPRTVDMNRIDATFNEEAGKLVVSLPFYARYIKPEVVREVEPNYQHIERAEPPSEQNRHVPINQNHHTHSQECAAEPVIEAPQHECSDERHGCSHRSWEELESFFMPEETIKSSGQRTRDQDSSISYLDEPLRDEDDMPRWFNIPLEAAEPQPTNTIYDDGVIAL
jgi:HSP20 family molecular chaperone IbpA